MTDDIVERMKEALKVAETELTRIASNEGWLSSELALDKVRAALAEAEKLGKSRAVVSDAKSLSDYIIEKHTAGLGSLKKTAR
jgi:hypothetical protein